MAIRRPSRRNPHTFLVHVFGRGLDGECYLVERYRARPDDEIRRVRKEQPEGRRRRRRRHAARAGRDHRLHRARSEGVRPAAVGTRRKRNRHPPRALTR